MVSLNGEEKVSDSGGKGKRKWNGGGGDDDKTGRKTINRGVLQFFDDSAYQVDEGEDSSDDSLFDDLEEEIFPELNDKFESGKATPLPFIPKEEVLSEEELERMYEERYKPGSGFVTYTEDCYEPEKYIDRDIYVPSSKDPTTWKVKCMVGRERDASFTLMQKYVDLDYCGTKLQIISACAVDHVKGFIFVEAEKQNDIYEACKGLSYIYSSRVTAVPNNDRACLLALKAERKAQAFEKMKSRGSHRRGAPASARHLSSHYASPPPTRAGEFGKKPVWEAEGPAVGSVSVLGWDPEKVERTRDYVGKRPPFQISFLRTLPPNQAALAILPPSVGSAMDACSMAWTEELEGYASTMAATDLSVCSAILHAQASVFSWKAHHILLEDQKKYTAARQENRKCSEKLKKYNGVIQDLSEQLTMAREKAVSAEKAANLDRRKLENVLLENSWLERELKAARAVVRDERAVIQEFKRSAEYKAELSVAYVHAFQDAIQQARDSIPGVDVGHFKKYLAGYLTENPLPAAYYLWSIDNFAEYTPAGFVEQMRPAPPIKLMSVDPEDVEEEEEIGSAGDAGK